MHPLDWAIVAAYISWLVWDGVKRTRLERTTASYFLANRSLPWWAVGLSVMATQLSAITLVGTTGQGYNDGMRFVQFYYGLPIAMVLVGAFAVPMLRRARVYTAYEYLERRFDAKTRALTSLLFLLSRAMSCGVIVAAPAVVLSVILGWDVSGVVEESNDPAWKRGDEVFAMARYPQLGGGYAEYAAVPAGDLAKLVGARERIPRAAFDEALTRLGEPGFSADPYLAQEAVADASELEPIVERILAANPSQVEAYRNGKEGLLGFLVGQVMKETKGKANPRVVNELVREKLTV